MEFDHSPESTPTPDRATGRRWNAPSTRAKRRRAMRADQGARVLELLAQIRDGTLPPESPDALP